MELDFQEDLLCADKKKLTKKERRVKRKNAKISIVQQPAISNILPISPKTKNQSKVFESFSKGKNLLLYGTAGTGKTFIALYLAMKCLEDKQQDKVFIVRSLVPSREIGFLPGDQNQKSRIYEAPYYGLFSELYGKKDAYDTLKKQGKVEFLSSSFVRGTTIRNSVIIVDEVQNMTDGETNSILTRVGENCRVIVCGDIHQNDLLDRNREKSGMEILCETAKHMKSFASIQFTRVDILRSDFLKEFIIARENYFAQKD